MGDYRITCTIQTDCSPSARHIVSVGLEGHNTPRYTVSEVYALMDSGHRLYTTGGDARSWVRKWTCRYCLRPTLRSHPGATTANDLEALPRC